MTLLSIPFFGRQSSRTTSSQMWSFWGSTLNQCQALNGSPAARGGAQKGCFVETKFNHCESVSGPRRLPRGASRPAQAAQPAGSSDAAAAAAVSAASDTLFLCAARRLGGVRGGDVGNLEPARARARLSTTHCKPNQARRLELSGRAQLARGSAGSFRASGDGRRRQAVFCSSMLFSIPACGC